MKKIHKVYMNANCFDDLLAPSAFLHFETSLRIFWNRNHIYLITVLIILCKHDVFDNKNEFMMSEKNLKSD